MEPSRDAAFPHRGDPAAESEFWRGYPDFQKLFPMTEVAIPAAALQDYQVAQLAREHGVAVDVRNIDELRTALEKGIEPVMVVLLAESLFDYELRYATGLGVGRIIVGSIPQIELLGSLSGPRAQGVFIRMIDPQAPVIGGAFGIPCGSREAACAVEAVLAHSRLALQGFHANVADWEGAFAGCSAAIGDLTTEMVHVRHRGVVLARLGLEYDVPGPVEPQLQRLAAEVEGAIDDACVVRRYPHPRVLLSAHSTGAQPAAA